MVCKDSSTLQLLEVSNNVKAKYQEQAQNADTSFLLSCLNISSTCDQQYKGSKNQRLHVELALMKMAHVQQVLEIKKKD